MIRNTDISYGSVAKWLHWLTALLVLVAYLLVLYLKYVLSSSDDCSWLKAATRVIITN